MTDEETRNEGDTMSAGKKRRKAAGSRRKSRWLNIGMAALGLALVIQVALVLWRRHTPRAEGQAYAPAEGPLTFPARVTAAPPELRALYEFAARRPDVLHYLPCYCGCGSVHRSNHHCFIDAVRADGTVLIDDMSFT